MGAGALATPVPGGQTPAVMLEELLIKGTPYQELLFVICAVPGYSDCGSKELIEDIALITKFTLHGGKEFLRLGTGATSLLPCFEDNNNDVTLVLKAYLHLFTLTS